VSTTVSIPAAAPANQDGGGRISVAKATALILRAHLHDGLPYPYGINQNGGDSDLLCLQFHTHAEVRAWHTFFGVTPAEPTVSNDGQRSVLIDYGRKWNGWTVGLYAFEPLSPLPEPDAETEALIAEALAVPVTLINAPAIPIDTGQRCSMPSCAGQPHDGHGYACCGKVGRISRHEPGCPLYAALNPGGQVPVHAEVSFGPGGMIGVTFPQRAADELAELLTEPKADEVLAPATVVDADGDTWTKVPGSPDLYALDGMTHGRTIAEIDEQYGLAAGDAESADKLPPAGTGRAHQIVSTLLAPTGLATGHGFGRYVVGCSWAHDEGRTTWDGAADFCPFCGDVIIKAGAR
jgi:hypothetical protein